MTLCWPAWRQVCSPMWLPLQRPAPPRARCTVRIPRPRPFTTGCILSTSPLINSSGRPSRRWLAFAGTSLQAWDRANHRFEVHYMKVAVFGDLFVRAAILEAALRQGARSPCSNAGAHIVRAELPRDARTVQRRAA